MCTPGDIVGGTIYEINGVSKSISMEIIDPGFNCDLSSSICSGTPLNCFNGYFYAKGNISEASDGDEILFKIQKTSL